MLFSSQTTLSTLFFAASAAASVRLAQGGAAPTGRITRTNGVIVPITVESPLVECETVSVDWSSNFTSKRPGWTYRLTINLVWTDPAGRPSFLPVQEIDTSETSVTWDIDYPAGTVVQFLVKPWSVGTKQFYGESSSFTIQAGSAKCTPAIHRSMIITPPAKLVQCEPFAFAWEGGEGPFRAFISGKVPGGSNTWIRSSHGTVGNVSFARIEDFPIGTEVEISIANYWEERYRSAFRMVISGRGKTSSCIPASHLPPNPWFRRPFPIIMLILTILLTTFLALYGTCRACKLYRKHRKGEILLPLDK